MKKKYHTVIINMIAYGSVVTIALAENYLKEHGVQK